MPKPKYWRNIQCSHEGCTKMRRAEYDTHKEYVQGHALVGKWKCIYHVDVDSVLSPSNTYITVELKCVEKVSYGYASRFWQYKKDWGTDKCDSGFLFGTGYKMNAEHFPVGTIIKVAVEVVLPKGGKETES